MTDERRRLYADAAQKLAKTVDFAESKMMGMPALKRDGGRCSVATWTACSS